MNSKYLGDALDHWKGSLFQRLRNEKLFDLYVEPMITDPEPWSQELINLFVKMLCLDDTSRILNSDKTFHGDRNVYFNSIKHDGDLFVDPDTGVAIGSTITNKHIKVNEIQLLLQKNQSRIIAVYQHKMQGKNMSDTLGDVIGFICKNMHPLSWTSYMSAHVAMIFISEDNDRIQEIREYHRTLFRPVAVKRIR
jgi:hypothetical protein